MITKFRPEYLNPNSVSMGVHPDGKWVRYDDLPVWYRKYMELVERLTTDKPRKAPNRAVELPKAQD